MVAKCGRSTVGLKGNVCLVIQRVLRVWASWQQAASNADKGCCGRVVDVCPHATICECDSSHSFCASVFVMCTVHADVLDSANHGQSEALKYYSMSRGNNAGDNKSI